MSVAPVMQIGGSSLESSREGERLVREIINKRDIRKVAMDKQSRWEKESFMAELRSYQGLWEAEDKAELETEVSKSTMLRRCLVVEELVEGFVKGGMELDEEVMNLVELVKEEVRGSVATCCTSCVMSLLFTPSSFLMSQKPPPLRLASFLAVRLGAQGGGGGRGRVEGEGEREGEREGRIVG